MISLISFVCVCACVSVRLYMYVQVCVYVCDVLQFLSQTFHVHLFSCVCVNYLYLFVGV